MAKIKILAGTYAGNEYRYIKNKDRMMNVTKVIDKENFYLSNISSIEIANQDNCKKAGGTIAAAAIGGLLLGGVGAIVGGMAGGNQQISTIIITYENGSQSLAQIDGAMHTILQTMIFDKKAFMATHKKTKGKFLKYFLIFLIVVILLALITN
ncbi:hypothetical protein IEG79_001553 [Campylobacter upsaliensis]|uniref:Uncharacterized protein n=1 Tax=Campylobacter upsaliensis TaxID=28080 RepID=A0A448KLH5_CAMUP|nr:hypothetical protein [Campylobacter upsaliensis]EAH5887084.1 hypothetical protein [Campylobacter upsaliensis]EAI6710903.1 hypothetical protein [Campylobacter upsaliensis]EAJ1633355.1 hypothetical protein [Campylobacter upsaliensis]EAJ1707832.1 hypothetical protein [Campylobacter upsaliensis]EAJ3606142.1 hypothetical protein [Campylobacter upsaliensis]